MSDILLPPLNGSDQPFWDGLREQKICVQRCAGCGQVRFPAAVMCTQCGNADAQWVAVAQRGEIESHCTFHKAYLPGFKVPYSVILVRLDCGLKVFSNLLGDAQPQIGMAVEAVFEPFTDNVTLLKFRNA